MDIEKIKTDLEKIINKALRELKHLDYEFLTGTDLIKVVEGCVRLEKTLAKAPEEDDLEKIWKEIQDENDKKPKKEAKKNEKRQK